jgi:hypothetical protein
MTQRTTQANKFGSAAEAKTAAGAIKAKTESQTLAEANPGRVALYVTNDGEKTVYLALGAKAVKNEGIRLNEKGGAVVIDNYTGVVSVVTASEESVVAFTEV